ncbi:MAG: hypothetical protein R2798_12395 [Chitinophagales bacterium]|nr:hypothetical protein [Bacteroidota bacterium]MCB9043049.1 hypothetical protein [Chitinophagales bacterium]
MKKIITLFLLVLFASMYSCEKEHSRSFSHHFLFPLETNYTQDTISLNDTLVLSSKFSELYDTLYQEALPLEEFAPRPSYFLIIYNLDEVVYPFLSFDQSVLLYNADNENIPNPDNIPFYNVYNYDDPYTQVLKFFIKNAPIIAFTLENNTLALEYKCVFTKPGNYGLILLPIKAIFFDNNLDFNEGEMDISYFFINLNNGSDNNNYLLEKIENNHAREELQNLSPFMSNFCLVVKE